MVYFCEEKVWRVCGFILCAVCHSGYKWPNGCFYPSNCPIEVIWAYRTAWRFCLLSSEGEKDSDYNLNYLNYKA